MVTVDGKLVAAPERTRLFRYHKPDGLVTPHRDPKGRPTVFETLPPGLPRAGLDRPARPQLRGAAAADQRRRAGARARAAVDRLAAPLPRARASAPSTTGAAGGAGRRASRSRASPTARSRPGSTAGRAPTPGSPWRCTRARTARCAACMEHLGLKVTRLIRIAYGPFQLGALPRGAVEEVQPKVLREQLGLEDRHAGAGALREVKAEARAERGPRAAPARPPRARTLRARPRLAHHRRAASRPAAAGARRARPPARPPTGCARRCSTCCGTRPGAGGTDRGCPRARRLRRHRRAGAGGAVARRRAAPPSSRTTAPRWPRCAPTSPPAGRRRAAACCRPMRRKPPRAQAPCDLVFLDPPYREGLMETALAALLAAGWIAPGALVCAEYGVPPAAPAARLHPAGGARAWPGAAADPGPRGRDRRPVPRPDRPAVDGAGRDGEAQRRAGQCAWPQPGSR